MNHLLNICNINGAEFDEQYKDPPHLFAMWWNKTIETQTTDKCKLKKYRTLANGDCVEAKDLLEYTGNTMSLNQMITAHTAKGEKNEHSRRSGKCF